MRPEQKVCVERDTSFHMETNEVLDSRGLQIVSDSILVIKKRVDDASQCFFSAYSLQTLQYLGSFFMKGRGPGEAKMPSMAAVNSSSPCLYVRDNSLSLSWELDVLGSIRSREGIVARTVSLQFDSPAWIPITDSLRFAFDLKQRELLYCIVNLDGEERESFSPYQNLDGRKNLTVLSDIPVSDGVKGKIAFPMVNFPFVHLLDVADGKWRTITVDKCWRKWKQILN